MSVCEQCQRAYEPKGYPHRGPQRFCSIACYRAWMRVQGRTATCQACRTVFKARGKVRHYCSRVCYRTATKTEQAHRLDKAQEARRKLANDRVRALLTHNFGTVNPRELALFKWAWAEAYRKGYNRAYVRRGTK